MMIGTKLEIMKILWVDDDINSFVNRAFVDELTENGYNLTKISEPDSFFTTSNLDDYCCIIIDIMMPYGSRLTKSETKSGLLTGLQLLKYLKDKNRIYLKKTIVLTISDNSEVKKWADEHGIPVLFKQDVTSYDLSVAVDLKCK